MDEKKGSAVKSGKPIGKEFFSDEVIVMRPVKSNMQRILGLTLVKKSAKCSSMLIKYQPYMGNISGSIILNAYDIRYENPQKALLIHTSFPANHDQFINLKLNVVVGSKEKEDPVRVEMFAKDVDTATAVNYAYARISSRYEVHKKRMLSGVASIESSPPLMYTRGDLLPARFVEKFTRSYGFIGPPLQRGADYVIEGIGTKGKLLDLTVASNKSHNKEHNTQDLEDPPITV
ncbi:TPA_asm: P3 [Morus betacytorhabdovirus 1]|nr:TPA_asm: P3 [Morus betacytorhabdovirus 1]